MLLVLLCLYILMQSMEGKYTLLIVIVNLHCNKEHIFSLYQHLSQQSRMNHLFPICTKAISSKTLLPLSSCDGLYLFANAVLISQNAKSPQENYTNLIYLRRFAWQQLIIQCIRTTFKNTNLNMLAYCNGHSYKLFYK